MEFFRANPRLDHVGFNAFLKEKYCEFYRIKASAMKLVESAVEY